MTGLKITGSALERSWFATERRQEGENRRNNLQKGKFYMH